MNLFSLKFMFVFVVLFISGCQSENDAPLDSKVLGQEVNKAQPPVVKEQDNRPLSERKTGDFISKVMTPLADYDYETNQDIYVNISGRLVNTNKRLNWAIIKDKDVYFFAFGHASMTMFSQDALGKQVYIRAIVEETPLTENELVTVRNQGLAPDSIPENYAIIYRLNTTEFAIAEQTTSEEFINKN